MHKVLLVDDNPLILQGLTKMIRWTDLGAQLCGTAESGAEALQLIAQEKPRLVITDVEMPNGTGLTLLEHIQAFDPPPSAIIISAYDNFQYAKKAIGAGVVNYLLKPIDPEELNASIARALEVHRDQRVHDLTLAEVVRRIEESSPGGAEVWVVPLVVATDPQTTLPDQALEVQGDGETFEVAQPTGFRILLATYRTLPGAAKVRTLAERAERQLEALGIRHVVGVAQAGHPRDLWPLVDQARADAARRTVLPRSAHRRDPVPPPEDPPWLGFLEQWQIQLDSRRFLAAARALKEAYPAFADHGFDFFLGALRVLLGADQSQVERTMRLIHDLTGRPEVLRFFTPAEILGEVDAILGALADRYLAEETNRGHFVRQIQRFVQKHYGSEVNINTLAGLFSTSPSYLSRVFKEVTGQALSHYLTEVRLGVAKVLLASPDTKVSDAAQLSGYEDQSYFAKVFKKSTGLTPAEYRASRGLRSDFS